MSQEHIDVYAVGSTVLLDGSVSVQVKEIFIRDAQVSYVVVWWNDRERNEEEVESWEVLPDSETTKSLRICPIL